MKAKILLAVAVIGAASLSAHAGVRIGVSIGLPLPLPVVAVSAPACRPPVVVAAPACPPPAVVTTAYVVAAPCPGPDYAWVAGYWSVGAYGRVWVPGAWRHHTVTVVVGHRYGGYGYADGHVDARYGRGWH